MIDLENIITQNLKKLIIHAVTSIPEEVVSKLKDIQIKEKNNPIISSQVDLMIENIEYGITHQIPICQDTGLENFFIQVGQNFPIISDFKFILLQVMKELTQEAILRPNTIDPFSKSNELNNGGMGFPLTYLDILPNRSDLIITCLPKGGGAENISKLFMLSPSNGLSQIIPIIKQTLNETGGKPCPPVIIGIGIGGDATKTMYLAKKALLRPLGSRNSRKEVADLENKILNEVNQLNIGVMGFGGGLSCLDVRIEWAMRHPASFPLGIVIQCYCHRITSFRINPEGIVNFGYLDNQFMFQEDDKIHVK